LRTGFPFHRILRATVKPDPHDNLVPGSGEDLAGFESLKQVALEPYHIIDIIAVHRPFVLKTHDFPEARLVQRHMGVRRVSRRAGELPVYLRKVRFLKKPVRLRYHRNSGKPQFYGL
jgi:hypothetical protein